MTPVWWLRWVLVAIAVVLGAILISRHRLLVGALILALAVGRAVLLMTMRRRRQAWRQRGPGPLGPPR